MVNNPIPIILVLLLVRSHNSFRLPPPGSLELEAFLDQARTCLNAIDKISTLTGSAGGSGSGSGGGSLALPDMKKMMEIVEKLPL